MNKSIKEQLEEIEPIIPIAVPQDIQKIYDEEIEWLRVMSGINEDLLGKSDEVKPLYKQMNHAPDCLSGRSALYEELLKSTDSCQISR